MKIAAENPHGPVESVTVTFACPECGSAAGREFDPEQAHDFAREDAAAADGLPPTEHIRPRGGDA